MYNYSERMLGDIVKKSHVVTFSGNSYYFTSKPFWSSLYGHVGMNYVSFGASFALREKKLELRDIAEM